MKTTNQYQIRGSRIKKVIIHVRIAKVIVLLSLGFTNELKDINVKMKVVEKHLAMI